MTYQDYVDHVLADSPLLYWPLQETSGSAQDATANNRDGTVASGGLWVPTNPHGGQGRPGVQPASRSDGGGVPVVHGDDGHERRERACRWSAG
jgi:hypothetical protein